MNQALDIMMVHECSGEHFHDYPQIMVPLNDSMQIMIGSMQYDVTPQELCFVPTGMQHQCNFNGRMLVINLSDQLPESGEVVMISSPLIVPMRGQIVQLVELIQAELKQNPDSTAIRHLYKYLYAKIMEIAVMVGYSGNSTFTRAFHNVTGMTPKTYRDCACFKQPQAVPGGQSAGSN